jgi:hypothetical protein
MWEALLEYTNMETARMFVVMFTHKEHTVVTQWDIGHTAKHLPGLSLFLAPQHASHSPPFLEAEFLHVISISPHGILGYQGKRNRKSGNIAVSRNLQTFLRVRGHYFAFRNGRHIAVNLNWCEFIQILFHLPKQHVSLRRKLMWVPQSSTLKCETLLNGLRVGKVFIKSRHIPVNTRRQGSLPGTGTRYGVRASKISAMARRQYQQWHTDSISSGTQTVSAVARRQYQQWHADSISSGTHTVSAVAQTVSAVAHRHCGFHFVPLFTIWLSSNCHFACVKSKAVKTTSGHNNDKASQLT